MKETANTMPENDSDSNTLATPLRHGQCKERKLGTYTMQENSHLNP
jgi:hypothetical protein